MKIRAKYAVLLSAIIYAGNIGAETSAHQVAEGSRPAYHMAAVVDRARGDMVVSGEYTRAIEALESQAHRPFASRTNLCVAYALSGDLGKADVECGAALRLSRDKADKSSGATRRAARRDMALALSNMGVVRAVSGDLIGAYADFNLAVELSPGMRQADANLRKLKQEVASDV